MQRNARALPLEDDYTMIPAQSPKRKREQDQVYPIKEHVPAALLAASIVTLKDIELELLTLTSFIELASSDTSLQGLDHIDTVSVNVIYCVTVKTLD